MTDNEILTLMRDTPPQGQKALFDKYYRYVYTIVQRILRGFGSPDDCDECTIDVFASVMMNLKGADIGALNSYIGAAARNAAISMRRKLAAKTGLNDPIDDENMAEIAEDTDVAAEAEKNELSEQLLNCISELGYPDSVIIIQKYYYSRSSKEIAEMTGLNAAGVRVRCGRAMKRLKKLLEENNITL